VAAKKREKEFLGRKKSAKNKCEKITTLKPEPVRARGKHED